MKKKDISKFPATGYSWGAIFKEGENVLIANGYEDGKLITSDTASVNYSFEKNSKPVKIALTSERRKNGNYLVHAKAVDKDGNICLDYNKRVYFSLEGSGKLIENYGVPGKSSIIEMANGQASIEVKAIPFEKATVEVRNQDFKGSYLSINK